jgi:peptide/nickel transport system substrate-binding protein
VTLKQPWVPFPFLLSGGIGGQIGYVAAPSMIANKNGGMQPVGTGPFKFGEWVQNSHFTANRNPNYWRSGYPYLDSIKYTPIADSAGRAQALAAGTVDMIHTDLAETTLQYQNQSGFGFVDDLNGVVGEPDMDLLLLNLSAAPFNDIRVRQAVAMCLNLEEYKTVENKGLNPVSTGPFVAGSPYYNANSGYPAYNPTQAKALVQQVMRDNGGKPVTFEFGSSTSSNAVKAAQILQANMQTVGMQVTLAQVEQNALISNALAGKFQCYEWRQFAAVDPDLNYPFWSPTTDFAGLGISADMTRNTDPKIETLLQQGRTSVDPQTRAQAYQNLQAQFAQDLPYIWYDRAVWSVIAQGKVQNFNNPTTPEGDKGFGMIVGTVWPTQIWLQS